MEKKKGRGRPRIHADGAERVKSFRKRKQAEGRRLDIYISTSAGWCLTTLAEAWGCSYAKVVERLLLEADQRYGEILFSESKAEKQIQ